MNDRYFVNVSAGGFIAEVSDAVNPQLKTIAGKFAYLLGGAQVALNYEPVRATIRASGKTESRMLQTFAVCNSQLIGGGRRIAPHAVIDDGLLDVCVIEAMPTVEFLALLRQLSSGDHLDDPRVTYLQTEAHRAHVRSSDPREHRRPGARGRVLRLLGAATRGNVSRAATGRASVSRISP